MKICYYPGCTLKTKALNLEKAALASLDALGIDVEELDRWNCCGAVFSLASDDLLHMLAPVRDLIRAKDQGAGQLMTICSQCYNTLARANELMKSDAEKRHTINTFMDEETDYAGEVEVVHFLQLIKSTLGWDGLAAKVTRPLSGLKVAPAYGCTLVRPQEVAIDDDPSDPAMMREFLLALGATPVDFAASTECCGSYEILVNPEEGLKRAAKVVGSACESGADAMIVSCPVCEYNLGRKQPQMKALGVAPEGGTVPVYYLTQLLAVALGLADRARLDMNMDGAEALLAERSLLG